MPLADRHTHSATWTVTCVSEVQELCVLADAGHAGYPVSCDINVNHVLRRTKHMHNHEATGFTTASALAAMREATMPTSVDHAKKDPEHRICIRPHKDFHR
jgi:hypothetical protein